MMKHKKDIDLAEYCRILLKFPVYSYALHLLLATLFLAS